MKIVKLRFRKGVRRLIKESQVLYDFVCPLKSVEVGDFVVVEVRRKRGEEFDVGRIEEIVEISEEKLMISKPYSYVICKVSVKDFDKRCREIKNMKFKLYSKYNGIYNQKIKK